MNPLPTAGDEVIACGFFATVIAVNRSLRKAWVDGPDIGDRVVLLEQIEPTTRPDTAA